jgi:hypothetical protein
MRSKPKHGLKAGTIVEVSPQANPENNYLAKVLRWHAVMGDPANLPRYGTESEYVPVLELPGQRADGFVPTGGLMIPKSILRVVGNAP